MTNEAYERKQLRDRAEEDATRERLLAWTVVGDTIDEAIARTKEAPEVGGDRETVLGYLYHAHARALMRIGDAAEDLSGLLYEKSGWIPEAPVSGRLLASGFNAEELLSPQRTDEPSPAMKVESTS